MDETLRPVLCPHCGGSLGNGDVIRKPDAFGGGGVHGVFLSDSGLGAARTISSKSISPSGHIPLICVQCPVNRRGTEERRKRNRIAPDEIAAEVKKAEDDGGVQ